MLSFFRKQVIGDAQQPFNGDFQAGFLASLPYCACFERLQIIQFAADNTPTSRLGRPRAKRKKYPPASVDQEDSYANPGMRIFYFAAARCFYVSLVPAHLISETTGALASRDSKVSAFSSTMTISQ